MSKLNKKIFKLLIFFYGCSILCVAQSITKTPTTTEGIEKTEFIKVYRCDRLPSNCYDTKDISIIVAGKVSPCFKLLKTLDKPKTRKLISILTSKSCYKKYPYDAFTTDYSIILFNNKKAIIGSINFSFICSNLYSDIALKQKEALSPKNPNEVGLSEYGKKEILKTIGITKY